MHHCCFIHNCIGLRNHGHWLRFILYAFMGSIFAVRHPLPGVCSQLVLYLMFGVRAFGVASNSSKAFACCHSDTLPQPSTRIEGSQCSHDRCHIEQAAGAWLDQAGLRAISAAVSHSCALRIGVIAAIHRKQLVLGWSRLVREQSALMCLQSCTRW